MGKEMVRHLALFVALVVSNGAIAKVDLENAYLLSPGMTKKDVVDTLGGRPNTTEFVGPLEEWHYCTDGFSVDKFAAIFLKDGQVYALKEYRYEGRNRQCEKNLKQGTYSEPDIVKEYRVKYR